MSQIKLKHSGGNGVIIAAPSSNPASDRTITLPSDADGTLARTSDVAFKSYAIVADVKANNASGGGTNSTGGFYQRDLNTELDDPDGIVSLSNNHFILQAGSYLIKWKTPFYRTERTVTELVTVASSGTGGATRVATGTSEILRGAAGEGDGCSSFGSTRQTISSETYFAIRYRTSRQEGTSGLGFSHEFTGASDPSNVFTLVEIYKEV